jgi:AmmeMemoRadiSam system protein B
MPGVRRAAVAGTWYPDDPSRLAAAVDAYVDRATVEPIETLRAVVAPHAGLRYSGPVAAFAYRAASGTRPDSLVLVGPSHFVPFRGVSIWRAGAWESPLGPVPVDAPLAEAIVETLGGVADVAAAHAREHSLEMQLPFIARLLPGVPIVPILMGYQTRKTAFELGDALARAACRWPGRLLLVASSDLSHYQDAAAAAVLDGAVMAYVESLDPEGLMTLLEREPSHACGGGPMVAVLQAARAAGACEARVLQYGDSGDVTGDKSSVVGYMAAAVW